MNLSTIVFEILKGAVSAGGMWDDNLISDLEEASFHSRSEEKWFPEPSF